ncbi:aldo/keto reductase [Streptomyces sp. NPDC058335]|uniref:aldo/keto reductase n=1 Tax=Streptomyces sp. NPDC058335 TaxID=3346451 RepID=UPI00365CF8EA
MTSETITADAARTRRLGDTTVGRIGFGAMRPTGDAAFHLGTPSDRDRSVAVLRKAVDLGVNHIDTAAFYFSTLRSANELINSALAPYRTTCSSPRRSAPSATGRGSGAPRPAPRTSAATSRRTCAARPRPPRPRPPAPDEPGVDRRTLGALAELRQAGLVRHPGISGVEPRHLAGVQAIAPVVGVQNHYGLGDHRPAAEELLRLCGEQGIAFVPFYAVAGDGGLRGATTAHDEAVLAAARAHGASPAQIRLAWTLAQGPHVLAVPGTGNPEHLRENVAAGALRLTDEELDRLNEAHVKAG